MKYIQHRGDTFSILDDTSSIVGYDMKAGVMKAGVMPLKIVSKRRPTKRRNARVPGTTF